METSRARPVNHPVQQIPGLINIYSLAALFCSRDFADLHFIIIDTPAFEDIFFEAVCFVLFCLVWKFVFVFLFNNRSMSDVTVKTRSLPEVAPGVTGYKLNCQEGVAPSSGMTENCCIETYGYLATTGKSCCFSCFQILLITIY